MLLLETCTFLFVRDNITMLLQGCFKECTLSLAKITVKSQELLTLLLCEGGQVCWASRAALALSFYVFPWGSSQFPVEVFLPPKAREQTHAFPPALSVCLASESHYRTRVFSAGSFPPLQEELSLCVLHWLSPLSSLQLRYWFLCWSPMGSSCLKLAKGSTIEDLGVFVEGMSFCLTGCEESTGRLCDAFAASSAIHPCFTLPAGLQTFLPLRELPACSWVPVGIRYTRHFPLTFRR